MQWWTLLFTLLIAPVWGVKEIRSNALLSCMSDSKFTASKFDVVLYPDNSTVYFDIAALSTIEGNITAKVEVIAYGITVVTQEVDACTMGVPQLCPISAGHIDADSSMDVPKKVLDQVPGIAYTIPDLDGKVKVLVYETSDMKNPIACVQTTLSNGKTVQTKWASWAMGIVCALGLLTAGIINAVGYYSTAAHIASNTVSLFEYFQSVAIVGMMAVQDTPPIAAAWVQNFQWSMGVIRVRFMQSIFNWYVQSTGGTASDILANEQLISIEVQKRGFDYRDVAIASAKSLYRSVSRGVAKTLPSVIQVSKRAIPRIDRIAQTAPKYVPRAVAGGVAQGFALMKRENNTDSKMTTNEFSSNLGEEILELRGMQRVAYLARIEITSLFLTALTFFVVLGVFLVICLAIFKGVCELIARSKESRAGMFSDYRAGWRTQIKGVLVRLVLIGFPLLSVFCLWEITRRDSVATVILAILTWLIVASVLGAAAYKVITIARRSQALHKNPAYILYSDPACLNKWGFLYIQFRATAYYFIVVVLGYTFIKACFIAFAQEAGKVQAMALFIIELAYLIVLCWLKPYMDKRTNGFNITIAVINVINTIFFLFFSFIFNQPDSVNGIAAVVFFVLNAVFSFILLVMIIVSCVWAWFSSNPDNRYQPMRDDRESFIRDPNVNAEKRQATELDALGASARDGYNPDQDYSPPPRSSLDGFGNGTNDSRPSFQQQEIFPQARLPRNGGPGEYLTPTGSGYYNPNNNYNEPVSRTESPGFPYETAYHGYQPSQRQPPRF